MIQLDPNLKTRVAEVWVPLLKDEEIKRLIENGFYLLNVVPTPSLVEKLVYYSDRLGAYAHQMCLDICKGKGITHTAFKKQHIDDDSFQYAVDGFINRSQDTLKSIYEAAVKNELGWYILKTFSLNVMSKLSLDKIYEKVNKGKCSFNREQIKDKLEELMDPSFNIIYYDSNSEKYALSTPFWHRFLRLQFSIEQSEQKRKKKNKQNPNLSLISNDGRYQIVDESMFELIKRLEALREQIRQNK